MNLCIHEWVWFLKISRTIIPSKRIIESPWSLHLIKTNFDTESIENAILCTCLRCLVKYLSSSLAEHLSIWHFCMSFEDGDVRQIDKTNMVAFWVNNSQLQSRMIARVKLFICLLKSNCCGIKSRLIKISIITRKFTVIIMIKYFEPMSQIPLFKFSPDCRVFFNRDDEVVKLSLFRFVPFWNSIFVDMNSPFSISNEGSVETERGESKANHAECEDAPTAGYLHLGFYRQHNI